MKTSLITEEVCKECKHRVEEHHYEDNYTVECTIEKCTCEEYDE